MHFDLKLGQRQIARSANISQSTVHDYLERFTAAGLSWPLPAEMSEAQLETALFPAALGKGREPESESDLCLAKTLLGFVIKSLGRKILRLHMLHVSHALDSRLIFGTITRLFCAVAVCSLENLALRQQLAVFKRWHPRPTLNLYDKLFWVAARRVWSDWKQSLIDRASGHRRSVASSRIQTLLATIVQSVAPTRWQKTNLERDPGSDIQNGR